MKNKLITILLLTAAIHAFAGETIESRTFTQVGMLVTAGDDTGWTDLGFGATFRFFSYFDAKSPDGIYWGFLGSALIRKAGGIDLPDERIITLGWRGNPQALFGGKAYPFDLDCNISPTIGSRSSGSTVIGSTYTGVGISLGISVPLFEGNALDVSWEPVFPVTTWGAPRTSNLGYSDFVISWTMKQRQSTRNLAWQN